MTVSSRISALIPSRIWVREKATEHLATRCSVQLSLSDSLSLMFLDEKEIMAQRPPIKG
jgi:hypothetical protein